MKAIKIIAALAALMFGGHSLLAAPSEGSLKRAEERAQKMQLGFTKIPFAEDISGVVVAVKSFESIHVVYVYRESDEAVFSALVGEKTTLKKGDSVVLKRVDYDMNSASHPGFFRIALPAPEKK
jgi:hypothetical protein